MAYENPARYNESLGKGEWDIGLGARDPGRGEYLAFSDQPMKSTAPASRSAWPRVRRRMVS
jgi:hypothetical protein